MLADTLGNGQGLADFLIQGSLEKRREEFDKKGRDTTVEPDIHLRLVLHNRQSFRIKLMLIFEPYHRASRKSGQKMRPVAAGSAVNSLTARGIDWTKRTLNPVHVSDIVRAIRPRSNPVTCEPEFARNRCSEIRMVEQKLEDCRLTPKSKTLHGLLKGRMLYHRPHLLRFSGIESA